MEHYRPISLCNTLYKLDAKILVRRLKGVLNYLMSSEQGAFVPGKSISDNILIAQEITHSLENFHGTDHYVLVKIDMERVYDKMQWDIIDCVLIHFGFDDTFHMWINGCMRDPLFSVLVNGSPTEFFPSFMSLRQGLPSFSLPF